MKDFCLFTPKKATVGVFGSKHFNKWNQSDLIPCWGRTKEYRRNCSWSGAFCGSFCDVDTQRFARAIELKVTSFLLYKRPSSNPQPAVINATMSQNVVLRQPLLAYDEERGPWRRAAGNLLWGLARQQTQADRQKDRSGRKRLNSSRYVKCERERWGRRGRGRKWEDRRETQGLMTK